MFFLCTQSMLLSLMMCILIKNLWLLCAKIANKLQNSWTPWFIIDAQRNNWNTTRICSWYIFNILYGAENLSTNSDSIFCVIHLFPGNTAILYNTQQFWSKSIKKIPWILNTFIETYTILLLYNAVVYNAVVCLFPLKIESKKLIELLSGLSMHRQKSMYKNRCWICGNSTSWTRALDTKWKISKKCTPKHL